MKLADHCPPVDCRYGAPMGRGFRNETSYTKHGRPFLYRDAKRDPEFAALTSLRRIHLDSGGYDQGGAYWGHGEPLFSALSDCGGVDMTFRAKNREEAKAKVREVHPKARFYR